MAVHLDFLWIPRYVLILSKHPTCCGSTVWGLILSEHVYCFVSWLPLWSAYQISLYKGWLDLSHYPSQLPQGTHLPEPQSTWSLTKGKINNNNKKRSSKLTHRLKICWTTEIIVNGLKMVFHCNVTNIGPFG